MMQSRVSHLLVRSAVLLRISLCMLVPLLSPVPALADEPLNPVEAALKSSIESSSNAVNRPAERDALGTFYAERGYRPIWAGETGPTPAGALVMKEIGDAGNWGLNPADFEISAANVQLSQGKWTASEAAAADYEISALILKYARQTRGGRITEPDRMLSSYLDRRPALPEPADVLATVTSAAAPDAALRSFQPQHEQFLKLHDLYVKLRGSQSVEQMVEVPPRGPKLKPGSKHADVAIIRQRLGVQTSGDDSRTYDDALLAAVKKFQASVSLPDDGIIGQSTRTALNAGAGQLKTVAANMEEWRWMPADLGQTHLFVNVPAFSIELVEGGAPVLQERVIVGKSSTQTPIFSKQLTTIVLNPQWYLPDSIKLEKLLAAQSSGRPIENEGYLVKKGSHLVYSASIDWTAANLNQYSIYQPSGDGNALGAVKFLFPNKHSVYLHDTPNKSLFENSTRLFSHGCVRLRNPLALAQLLLDADKGQGVWNVKKAVRKVDGNTEVMLDKPVPIHIAYFTVWIGADGEPRFLGDPYGHEARITLALEQRWDAIDKGKDHLAAVDTRQLKSVKLQAASKLFMSADGQPIVDPFSGLTKAGSNPKYVWPRSRGGGVGDMIRASLQH